MPLSQTTVFSAALKQGCVTLLGCVVISLIGCEHHDFKADGEIRAEGGPFGNWSVEPVGCSRDPTANPASEAAPPGHSTTLATFLWPDPKIRDHLRDGYKRLRPNAPMRLELSRTPGGPAASLETVRTTLPAVLDQSTCRVLHIETSEGPPVIEGGRPSLKGLVELDCRVNDTHITGKVRFSGCEF